LKALAAAADFGSGMLGGGVGVGSSYTVHSVGLLEAAAEAEYEDASDSTLIVISYSAAERKALSDRFGGGGTHPRAIIMKALKSLFEDLSSITAIEIDYIFKKSPSQPFEKDDLSSFDEDEAEQHVTISTTMEKG